MWVAIAILAWFAPANAETQLVQKSAPEGGALGRPLRPPERRAVWRSGARHGSALLGDGGRPGGGFRPTRGAGSGGIRTGALVRAVETYGWSAFRVPGVPAEVESHLARGRPVIALIRTGSGSYHYVVLVAWAGGWVILHDPIMGPSRTVREEEFETAWSGSDDWALVVLPPPAPREPALPDSGTADLTSRVVPDGCGALVEAGVLLARQGEAAEAELRFVAAQSLCPKSAAPVRERAGLRFRAEDWEGAGRLAEEALALDPGDAHSWRLLAGSRFLAGDVEGALTAWNRLSEPRLDLTHVERRFGSIRRNPGGSTGALVRSRNRIRAAAAPQGSSPLERGRSGRAGVWAGARSRDSREAGVVAEPGPLASRLGALRRRGQALGPGAPGPGPVAGGRWDGSPDSRSGYEKGTPGRRRPWAGRRKLGGIPRLEYFLSEGQPQAEGGPLSAVELAPRWTP